MNLKLKIFLIIVCLVFDFFVYDKIVKNKLQLKYSLIWLLGSLILIFVTIFDNLLIPIKTFLGFETISNMIFLIGFFLLTTIIFLMSLKMSEHSLKITKLTQEIAILKKELSKYDK